MCTSSRSSTRHGSRSTPTGRSPCRAAYGNGHRQQPVGIAGWQWHGDAEFLGLNYKNGVRYPVTVQTPQYRVDSMDDLHRMPVAIAGQGQPQLLSNLATFSRTSTPALAESLQRAAGLRRARQRAGHGSRQRPDAVDRLVAKYSGQASKATTITVRGQVQSMKQAFAGLMLGIGFAVLLVYFLMVVNFQSWLDPFIILMALPGALAGIRWVLFVTGTTLSVPSLMGCIMAIGVATSNSILMVTFANEQRLPAIGGHDARTAALLPVVRAFAQC